MNCIGQWLVAGNTLPVVGFVQHWAWLALGAYMLLEWYLPRSKYKANSTLEAIANVLTPALGRVPFVKVACSLVASKPAGTNNCADPHAPIAASPMENVAPSDPPAGGTIPPVILLVLIPLLASMGCANMVTVGNKVVAITAAATMSGTKIWNEADHAKEQKIIDDAKQQSVTREVVEGRIADWRKTSRAVDKSLDALTEAIIAAQQSLSVVESMNGKLDIIAWVGPLYHAAVSAGDALDAAGVQVPQLTAVLATLGKVVKP